MRLSFVVPAYNEEAYLPACLESVLAQTKELGDAVEIIVVNNASSDRTREVALGYAGVRVVDEPRKGLTFARQAGLNETSGELVAYIDADTRIPPGWLAMAEREFARDPEMVCLSGPFRYYDLGPLRKVFAEGLWSITAPPAYWVTGFMVLGANFVAKRAAIEKIGGFDTNIVFYGEDTNIAERLSKVGKAKFRMRFYILGSGRRLVEEGLLRTFWRYAMNYYTVAFYQKPHTHEYRDIR
jgi:glycosyltransferase involved in cell wall biosynthesis